MAFEEWRKIGVGRAIGKHSPDEAVAQRLGIGREALSHAELVALEAIGHHGQVVPLKPLADRLDLVRSDFDAGRIVQRQ